LVKIISIKKMKVRAKLNNLRISPRKVKLVTDLIKGFDVDKALIQLAKNDKKAGHPLMKLLKSAVANAENNFRLDKKDLYVYDIQVGEGRRLKRWMPRAYGRAAQILKRTSMINLILEERKKNSLVPAEKKKIEKNKKIASRETKKLKEKRS